MYLARRLSRLLPIQLNIPGMIPSVSTTRILGGGKAEVDVFARAYLPTGNAGSCVVWLSGNDDQLGDANESVHQSRRWRKRT